MFLIDTTRNGQPIYDPIVNQSLDNYLINDLKLPGYGVIAYVNQPCVIIGVHQNAYAEVAMQLMADKDIKLVRRSSGGGAVYQDYGNLVFENIVVGEQNDFGNFEKFAQPIIDTLQDLGIKDAELRGRNDMMADDKKVSGMTMVKVGDAFAAGGTLLFDLDMAMASRVLTPDKSKLSAKGVKSVNKRIANLKPMLSDAYQHFTIEDFKEYLLLHMFQVEKLADITTYHFTEKDWAIIDARIAEKYGTREWNYGKNPGFKEYRSKHFTIGTVAFNFTIENQIVSAFKIYGDMISNGDLGKIEKNIIGKTYEKTVLSEAFEASDLPKNIGQITGDELADLLLS